MLPDDPEHVLIQMADADSYFRSVYTLNVDSGTLRAVVAAHGPLLGWMADRDGVVRFGYGYRANARDLPGAQQREGPVANTGEVQALRGRELRAVAEPAFPLGPAPAARRDMADGPG